MYAGKLVFAQVMEHLPLHSFRRIVSRYAGERKVKSFSCLDQFLCIAFAQLTYRESLRDIEACLRAQQSKLYHLGEPPRYSRRLQTLRGWSREYIEEVLSGDSGAGGA